MKRYMMVSVLLLLALSVLSFPVVGTAQEKKAPDSVTIKLEGAKMPPVTFSHKAHIEKAKIDCAVCHHKDKDPKAPEACVKCHDVKEVKNGASTAKDAFHKQCIDCHKEGAKKGVVAPVKCNECHKR